MRTLSLLRYSFVLSLGVLLLSTAFVRAHRQLSERRTMHHISPRAPPDENVTFTFSLRGERFHLLEEKMLSIIANRDPWLSNEELKHYTTPSAHAKKSVEATLEAHGIAPPEYNHLGDLATVRSTVAQAERLFKTRLHQVPDTHTKRMSIRAEEIEMPHDLVEHVVNVRGLQTPVLHKPRDHEKRHNANMKRYQQVSTSVPTGPSRPGEAPPGCLAQNASWPCIARFYGYDLYPVKPDSESVAVLGYGGWLDASIYAFEQIYFPHKQKKLPHKLTTTDSGAWKKVHKDDIEAIIDSQMLLGTAYDLNISVILSQGDFTDTIEYVIAMPDRLRPSSVSLSYGIAEAGTSRAAAVEFCNKVQQLVALGTTYITSTGDNGVDQNDGKACPPFAADLASCCPYALGVGASTGFSPERAVLDASKPDVHNGWSGGGFSTYFDAPDYQKSVTKNYLSKYANPSWSHYYNGRGRGTTDIAAFGQWVNIATTAGPFFGYGTSASAPIVSGMIARLNAICKSKGKHRVGWVNPVLYSGRGAAAVRDITKGGAFSCPNLQSPLGFPCAQGWDPATGLGAPNFPGLVKAFC